MVSQPAETAVGCFFDDSGLDRPGLIGVTVESVPSGTLALYHQASEGPRQWVMNGQVRVEYLRSAMGTLQIMHKKPYQDCYWVEPGRFLAGQYPGAKGKDEARRKLVALLECGITDFIDLTEESEHGLQSYDRLLKQEAEKLGLTVRYRRIPIPDVQSGSAEQIGRILEAIEDCLVSGRPVYLHCWGGHGRTGMLVGCYLVQQGSSGKEALDRVRILHSATSNPDYPSPEAEIQQQMVKNWRPRLTLRSRSRGCLLGLASGDALGTTLEFKRPGSFNPISDMVGGGPFGLAPGQWTDDTSMALCLAESLIEKQGFDPIDQLERYVRWWKEGHLSSTGEFFDIGSATREALSLFLRTKNPFCGSTNPMRAGNGSLMRLAPVPIFFAAHPAQAIEMAADSSRTTHGAPEAIDACRYFAALIVGAVRGTGKETLLSDRYCPVEGYWKTHPLAPKIDEIAAGSFRRKEPPDIQGSGYVVKSLEAALWAFHKSGSFREGCLLAANLGDDADTTAAIYGQIAGAYYSAARIPIDWIERLALKETIIRFADGLAAGLHPK